METTKKTGLAHRDNAGKLQWALADLEALRPLSQIYPEGWLGVNYKALHSMVEVLQFGAKKYAPNAWKKGMLVSSCTNSLMRHIIQLINGETHDQESGINQYGHVLCNLMFTSWYILHKPELDDRHIESNPEYIIDHPDTVVSETQALHMLLDCLMAFNAGQSYSMDKPLIGWMFHYACEGYVHQYLNRTRYECCRSLQCVTPINNIDNDPSTEANL